MQTNILKAILTLVENPLHEIKNFYQNKNRANSMGDALEEYVKDLFANTLMETDEGKRLDAFNNFFSYTGNQNNPPDIMICNGDAIEVKKIEAKTANLALNSSYPKAKLCIESPMLTKACRECEKWNEKDIIYAVGVVNDNTLSSLCMVYGVDYAASAEIYDRIKDVIREGVTTIPDVEFSKTKELGRVNRVDPLGITCLRIRGMWHIENPIRTFKYVYASQQKSEFEFMAIINADKFNSFPEKDKNDLKNALSTHANFNSTDIFIKIPDNPTKLKPAKLITYFR